MNKLVRRASSSHLQVRSEEGGRKTIEGYFIVYNRETELWPGAYEEIAPGACGSLVGRDIKALIDHESRLVLGRTSSGTLKLENRDDGLWGVIEINDKDIDATNLHARVERGDVSQCSFGFFVESEEVTNRDDGSVKWRITGLELIEVSVVTFPAYKDTSVEARKQDFEMLQKRNLEARKLEIKRRMNETRN